MMKMFFFILMACFAFLNEYAYSQPVVYENVIIKKHQLSNQKDVVVNNSYVMCEKPSKTNCAVNLELSQDKMLLFFQEKTPQVDITYLQNNLLNYEKKEISKTFILKDNKGIFSFNVPEIETSKSMNSPTETKIEIKIN